MKVEALMKAEVPMKEEADTEAKAEEVTEGMTTEAEEATTKEEEATTREEGASTRAREKNVRKETSEKNNKPPVKPSEAFNRSDLFSQ